MSPRQSSTAPSYQSLFYLHIFLRNALRSLLTHSEINRDLLQEALRGSAAVVENIGLSGYHFFEVLSQVVCANQHHFTFAQVACLCLANLRHPSLKVRMLAFNMLEATRQQDSGLLTMTTFEPSSARDLRSRTQTHFRLSRRRTSIPSR
jgi:hypothetical protein